ncbi:thyroxine 5-deiodinase isoform X2 [Chroicocephalus ridibundus]|uniref:thyroxine 5-deiodinase isoform X2 n=1 Tax=Chroicocephalus ridibundus TaxID=1192867 RepID=UPI002FDD35F8
MRRPAQPGRRRARSAERPGPAFAPGTNAQPRGQPVPPRPAASCGPAATLIPEGPWGRPVPPPPGGHPPPGGRPLRRGPAQGRGGWGADTSGPGGGRAPRLLAAAASRATATPSGRSAAPRPSSAAGQRPPPRAHLAPPAPGPAGARARVSRREARRCPRAGVSGRMPSRRRGGRMQAQPVRGFEPPVPPAVPGACGGAEAVPGGRAGWRGGEGREAPGGTRRGRPVPVTCGTRRDGPRPPLPPPLRRGAGSALAQPVREPGRAGGRAAPVASPLAGLFASACRYLRPGTPAVPYLGLSASA